MRLNLERAAQQRRGAVPGQEGSIGKIGWGLVGQAVTDLCMHLRGPHSLLVDHYDFTRPEQFSAIDEQLTAAGDHTKAFLSSQSLTIAAGTTNVNKNVLAERVLGLPREPARST